MEKPGRQLSAANLPPYRSSWSVRASDARRSGPYLSRYTAEQRPVIVRSPGLPFHKDRLECKPRYDVFFYENAIEKNAAKEEFILADHGSDARAGFPLIFTLDNRPRNPVTKRISGQSAAASAVSEHVGGDRQAQFHQGLRLQGVPLICTFGTGHMFVPVNYVS